MGNPERRAVTVVVKDQAAFDFIATREGGDWDDEPHPGEIFAGPSRSAFGREAVSSSG